MSHTKTTGLKPCPLCHSDLLDCREPDTSALWTIRCDYCGITVTSQDRNGAIESWNKLVEAMRLKQKAIELTTKIYQIPEDLGGDYTACSPQLGEYAVCGDGDTPFEALESFVELLEDRDIDYIKSGRKG